MFIRWYVLLGVSCLLWLPTGSVLAGQDCAAADAVVRATSTSADPVERQGAFQRALVACPGHPAALNNLGDTYEAMGRLDQALDYYHRAADAYRQANASPDLRALPLFGVGDVYRKMQRPVDALYWYRKGLELEPGNRETQEAVADLTKDDPANLIDSRSIGQALDRTRGPGVLAAVALDEGVLPFAYNRADLLPQSGAQLREIAFAVRDALGAPRSLGVLSVGPPVAEIGGHADLRGSDDYNRDLAKRRAQAVVDALVEQFQIPRARLSVVVFGESRPVCIADTEACHARNRRVEVRRP